MASKKTISDGAGIPSDVHGKSRRMGRKLAACMEMLGWLYDRAQDEEFLNDVDNVMSGVSLLGADSKINVHKVPHIGPSKRYAVTMEYDRKTVMQASGPDLSGLAKGMMRSVTENMAEQVMSVFAEEAGDGQA